MKTNGKFLAWVEGNINGNVLLSKEQYRWSDDEDKSLQIARNMIIEKLYNSRQVMLRTVRDPGLRIDEAVFRRKAEFLRQSIKNVRKSII